MKKLILLLIFIAASVNGAFAGEKILIDNTDIQEFRGKQGKWILLTSKTAVSSLAKEFGTISDEIYAINDIPAKKDPVGTYIFIPYSEKYIQSLIEKGITRTVRESSDDEFLWPIEKVMNISSVLGFRGGKFHSGMDIPAERGVPVRASMDGRVIFSGYLSGFGNTIEIEHRNNFITRYAHNSYNFVKKGEFVKKGQYISCVGSTGNSTGNHLHYEIRCIDVPLDPLDFLPKNGSILMPHTMKNWK